MLMHSSKKKLMLLIACGLVFVGIGCQKNVSVATKPFPREALQVQITVDSAPATIKQTEGATLRVKVKNLGNAAWPAEGQPDGKYKINLSYHWLDVNGKVIVADGLRTALPHDFNPQEEISMNATVSPPKQAGVYVLEFDMVQEAVTWFKDQGSKTTSVTMKVE